VCAYRARQRGAPEPPVLVGALQEGDELAAAFEHGRELGQRLDQQRRVEHALRRDLAAARGELKAEQARFGWLRHEIDALRTRLADAERLGAEMHERLTALTQENLALRQQRLDLARAAQTRAVETAGSTGKPSSNRAQRRGAARKAGRRS
jgi:hypothetical protein